MEERLNAPPGSNKVEDLIMEDGEILVPEDFSDGVLQLSPRETSGSGRSALKSPCSTPRGQI